MLANRAGEHYLSPFYAVRICSREAKRKKVCRDSLHPANNSRFVQFIVYFIVDLCSRFSPGQIHVNNN